MHMCTCKKPIKRLVTCIHGQEISVLLEKSSSGSQFSLIPYSDYALVVLVFTTFKKGVTWLLKCM